MPKKLLSIISPCYNEDGNIEELYQRVCAVLSRQEQYDFEYVFIDNASTDNTLTILKAIAQRDQRVKIIVNTRNFGPVRSPYYGVLQTGGDATIYLASDLQDSPDIIPQFIAAWEEGYKIVLAAKPSSKTNMVMNKVRKFYYHLLDGISDVSIVKDATGFGLYDRAVLDKIREIGDPYPFFRGLICELGYDIKLINFIQPRRTRGVTKNNFYSLYDIAMLGIVSHSLVPIRLASFFGLFIGALSVAVAMVFLGLKLIWWDAFPFGFTPIIVGMFFMFGVILFFIGIIGEYIGSIHTYVQNRPIVVERERINFSSSGVTAQRSKAGKWDKYPGAEE
jgi:dolichol-phosphate mannosyltransferase